MERIAVISDVHGNIPALDAVMQDIRRRGITRILCLGDLVGKGPHSEVAVDRIRDACEAVVQGNWDEFIGKTTENETIVWHQKRLGEERIQYLASLPFSLDFFLSGKLVRLFHASPRSLYERIRQGDPLEKRTSLFENTELTERKPGEQQPDIVGYGDIHAAYVQSFFGKTLFNAGSVGNPLEITQASYAILEGEFGSQTPGVVSIQLVRVPYDISLALRLAEEESMPELPEYRQELTTARYRGLKG